MKPKDGSCCVDRGSSDFDLQVQKLQKPLMLPIWIVHDFFRRRSLALAAPESPMFLRATTPASP